ncbi:hypothetical protein VP01_3809g1 [Puccinia sorghi]|uniref:Uncharacterized protein n=1 Tax=Puccinia sorghi TaxID=27349 RepID=A0A0L6UU67_9BASI|nr:hypothetical protein VP01_3809g1 [Puccinia sorghi]
MSSAAATAETRSHPLAYISSTPYSATNSLMIIRLPLFLFPHHSGFSFCSFNSQPLRFAHLSALSSHVVLLTHLWFLSKVCSSLGLLLSCSVTHSPVVFIKETKKRMTEIRRQVKFQQKTRQNMKKRPKNSHPVSELLCQEIDLGQAELPSVEIHGQSHPADQAPWAQVQARIWQHCAPRLSAEALTSTSPCFQIVILRSSPCCVVQFTPAHFLDFNPPMKLISTLWCIACLLRSIVLEYWRTIGATCGKCGAHLQEAKTKEVCNKIVICSVHGGYSTVQYTDWHCHPAVVPKRQLGKPSNNAGKPAIPDCCDERRERKTPSVSLLVLHSSMQGFQNKITQIKQKQSQKSRKKKKK